MKEYEVEIDGITHVFLLDDDAAQAAGLKPRTKAAEKPKNKASKADANKAD